MKHTFALLYVLTLTISLMAQPILTRNDLAMPGDSYGSTTTDTVPDPGPGGANVTWDFSWVTSHGATQYLVVEPGSTAYASTYPDANLAEVNPGIYQYSHVTDAQWDKLGYVIPSYSTLVYDNPQTYLQFPVQYTDQWQDDYTYTINYVADPTITTYGQGSFVSNVDGYGTVILPQGVFENALRILVIGISSDTTVLGSGLYEHNDYHDTTYVWFTPSYPSPLCTWSEGDYYRRTTVTTGDTTVFVETDAFTSFALDQLAQPNTSAVTSVSTIASDLVVSPNPFTDQLHVTWQSKRAGQMQFELRDLQGQRLYSRNIDAQAGENSVMVRGLTLPSGVYVVVLHTVSGDITRKILRMGD